MELGGFGLICIIISFFIFLKPNDILLAVAFFSSFYASSVINFRSFNLQPGHFFLMMYALTMVFLGGLRKNNKLRKKPNRWLLMFVIISFASILIAYFFSIDIDVIGIGNHNQLKSSKVSFQNFTQYLYLLLGFVTYYLLLNYATKKPEYKIKLVWTLEMAGIVVLLIGLYQVIANKLDLPYDSIFRNQGENIWQTKKRVQATMNEASQFGQYCVYLLWLYLYYPMFKKRLYNILLILGLIVLGVMSSSSAFLFGGVTVIVLYLAFQSNTTKGFARSIGISILAIVSFIVFYMTNAYVQTLFNRTMNKLTLEDASGIARSYIYQFMLDVWKQYPLFGVGYGGGRSTDLYVNLLACVGIVGFLAFFGYIIEKFLFCFKNYKGNREIKGTIVFLSAFLITSFAIPDLTYLTIWCLFAVVDSQQYSIII